MNHQSLLHSNSSRCSFLINSNNYNINPIISPNNSSNRGNRPSLHLARKPRRPQEAVPYEVQRLRLVSREFAITHHLPQALQGQLLLPCHHGNQEQHCVSCRQRKGQSWMQIVRKRVRPMCKTQASRLVISFWRKLIFLVP